MMQLPVLYKATKNGSTQFCSITISDDTFTVTWGQVGGKEQSKSTQCSTTNAGRANERTPKQQVLLEAQAKWQKKVDTGYTVHLPSEAPADFTAINLPQKVKVFQEQLHNVADNVYVSDKLNGINGLYRLDNDSLTLYSRGGLSYPELPHLTVDILHIMKTNSLTSLNVELYIHGEHLQDIQSAVTKPNELSPRVQACIFELPDEAGTYTVHRTKLKHISDYCTTTHVLVIPSILVDKRLIESIYINAISRGCEGVIIRNPTGIYKYNERSSDVFKYKKMLQNEYHITGYELDKDGFPKLICESAGGEFTVRPRGDLESRRVMLANIDSYIGKWYTVDYEVLTKAGKPAKGIGVALRACDPTGEPIE